MHDTNEIAIPYQVGLALFKSHLTYQRLRMESQMKQTPEDTSNHFSVEERNAIPTKAPVASPPLYRFPRLKPTDVAEPTVSISVSLLSQFKPVTGTPERLGQQAYNFLGLAKLQSPENKAWADRLWESDGDLTRTMLAKVVDYNN